MAGRDVQRLEPWCGVNRHFVRKSAFGECFERDALTEPLERFDPVRANALESEAPDTVRFTRAIKDAVPYEDRRAVVEALWQVVLADGDRADEENALMRLTANLLGVSDCDSALARQKAQKA